MIDIQNILLPLDFSEASLLATKYGAELASRFSAKLHLLHVIEDPKVYLPMFDSSPMPSRQEFEEYAQGRLDAWVLPENADHLMVERRWVHGNPVAEIIRDAREQTIDLIVMGTHGRGFAAHVLMGSVAEKVVRKAPCPVLTVRPNEHEFIHP
ncbi:MAG: universal stress protein [Planctomycetaceae bacterium]